jgi:hypothetical protein
MTTVPTLAVSVTYCLWNSYRMWCQKRNSQLRQRVTYLLWVMANQIS